VELDLTARPSYNRETFLPYDAFLLRWSLAHPRYRAQDTRPAVVFGCPACRLRTPEMPPSGSRRGAGRGVRIEGEVVRTSRRVWQRP
jgi:hypothetical protein